jgi:GT2 family glycosyltransferase
MSLTAAIVIPTRDRPGYLELALASIAPQAREAGAEVLVVDDSWAGGAASAARRHGAHHLAHPRPLGANAARNTGAQASSAELVVFVDDDVEACEGWLAALLRAAERHPETDVLAGAILPWLEGGPPRSCGCAAPPITALDLGPADMPTRFAWSANMAVRRSALARAGPFDESLHGQGEEQEWQERLQAAGGGQALYVAAAKVMHRRVGEDARLPALARTAYRRGREARRFDARRGEGPAIARELVTLAGCAGHVLRRGCPAGLTMLAHSAGRLREALRERALLLRGGGAGPGDLAAGATPNGGGGATGATAGPGPVLEPRDDFLSGESGTVGGLDGVRRRLADRRSDARELLSGRRARLARDARRLAPRRVLAIGVVRERHRELADALVGELARTRHEIEIGTAEAGERGRFENLNLLLERHPPGGRDWLLVFDDDIELPRGFLDRFLFLAERFRLDLAQPAHRHASHAAWQVTRRQPGSVARETQFVEIGPLTAFSSRTFSTLLPFPPLRMGWGLDAHWAALAREHAWRCGVLDAVPIRHAAAPAASAYSRAEALAEARGFLRDRPHVSARDARRTLVAHSRW